MPPFAAVLEVGLDVGGGGVADLVAYPNLEAHEDAVRVVEDNPHLTGLALLLDRRRRRVRERVAEHVDRPP